MTAIETIVERHGLHYWNAIKLGSPDDCMALGTPKDWHEALIAAATMTFLGGMEKSEFAEFMYQFIAEAKSLGVITQLQIEQLEEQTEFFLSGVLSTGAPSFFPIGERVACAIDDAAEKVAVHQ